MSTEKTMSQATMCRCCKRLSEDVGKILVALDVEQLEDLLGDPVSNHVILHIDVLGSRIVDVVLCNASSSDIV